MWLVTGSSDNLPIHAHRSAAQCSAVRQKHLALTGSDLRALGYAVSTDTLGGAFTLTLRRWLIYPVADSSLQQKEGSIFAAVG